MKTPRERQIDQILNNIKFNWYIVPEQRLGQFLANYVFGHHTDPFYWQDEKLLNKESVSGEKTRVHTKFKDKTGVKKA